MRPGDAIHLRGIGTGVIHEIRRGGRVAVLIKNTVMVVREDQLETVETARGSRPRAGAAAPAAPVPARRDARSILDLHGRTVAEAEALIDAFLDDALLAGLAAVQIVHGRSGGRIRAAVHARLKQLPSVRAFRLDP